MSKPAFSPGKIVAIMCGQTLALVAIGTLLWWLSGRSLAAFVTFEPEEAAIGILLAGVLIVAAAAIVYGLPKVSEWLVRAQERTVGLLVERPLPFGAIVLLSLGAGIGEEALFRGGLQTLLGDYVPIWAAIALSSLAFALIHVSKPPITALLFAIGAIFGIIYWWTGSLLAVMIGHALYDVFALWYVQKEMHRLGLFDREPHTEAETSASTTE